MVPSNVAQTDAPVTVLIVDDHTVARAGLRAMLETNRQVQVVGEAADGGQAMEMVGATHPRVVLMDIRMPGADGLEVTRRLAATYPETAVVMITSYDNDGLVVDAVLAGAVGYLQKDVSCALLNHTIAAVASGGMLIKPELLHQAIKNLSDRRESTTKTVLDRTELEELTAREREVLLLLARGQTNKQIATSLAIAQVTVKKHVQAILAKLHAADRTQAAVAGVRLGLLH